MATIFIASGAHDGRWFPIGKKSMVLGRDEALIAQIVDPNVSRKHLRISYLEGSGDYVAEDLGSKNGVYVNNQKVDADAQAILKSDDLIRIGETLLLFTYDDFDGDDNALQYYHSQQRHVDTLSLEDEDAAAIRAKLREAAGETDGD